MTPQEKGQTLIAVLRDFTPEDTLLVFQLMDTGADLSVRDSMGHTALMIAARNGLADIVSALVLAGADPDARTATCGSAMTIAAAFHHDSTIAALINAGADANIADAEGLTPLMHMVFWNRPPVVRALIEAGADVHHASIHGDTALHWAAAIDNPCIAALLIEAGAPIGCLNNDGLSPHDIAAMNSPATAALIRVAKGWKCMAQGMAIDREICPLPRFHLRGPRM